MNTSNSFGPLEFGKKKRKKPATSVDQNSKSSDTVDVENELEYTNIIEDDDSKDINEALQCLRITSDDELLGNQRSEQNNSFENQEHSIVDLNFEEADEKHNFRALPKHAKTYELEKFHKNALLIFNHINVDGYPEPRLGTEKDVEVLTNTFERFGFEVKVHTDLNKAEIFKELKKFCKRDFTDYGCIGVAVLSHGSRFGMIHAKDQQYSEHEIYNELIVYDKPTLVTKPKFLIIQACRGELRVPGVLVLRCRPTDDIIDLEVSPESYILPVEADIIILHSCFDGTPSHRHEEEGSWFVQSLCKKINELSDSHDIESIMTEVKRTVAIEKEDEKYNIRTRLMQVDKQMPVMTSTLTRKLYFKKFGDPPFAPLVAMTNSQCHSCARTKLDAPATLMQGQLSVTSRCSCFPEHFEYMKNCFRHYLEDCPEDSVAQSYLDLADTHTEGEQFNELKEKISKTMCKHLKANASSKLYYKFLYFYNYDK